MLYFYFLVYVIDCLRFRVLTAELHYYLGLYISFLDFSCSKLLRARDEMNVCARHGRLASFVGLDCSRFFSTNIK